MTEDATEDEVGRVNTGEYANTAGREPGRGAGGATRQGEAIRQGDVPVAELGYAAASHELDAIIAELDQGVVDVDVLDVRFRRAIEIVEELDRRIRGARERVGELAPRLEAIGGEAAGTRPSPPGDNQNRPG